MNTISLFHNPALNFIKEVFRIAEVCHGRWKSLPLEVRQLISPNVFKGKLRDLNFDCEIIQISDMLFFTHGLPEKQVFSFHLYYFSFIFIDSSLGS